MLRNMKAKALALLTALAMMLGLGALFTATPAFAAGTDGRLPSPATTEFKGKTITVYQMFNETGDDGSEQYVLVEAWKSFFTTEIGEGGIGLPNDNLSGAAYTYVKNLGNKNDQKVSDFAKKAAAWAEKNSITGTKSSGATGPTGDSATYTAQVTNLSYGYYLVIPQTGSTPSTEDPYKGRGTDAILVNVNSAEGATQALKSVYPTPEKTVQTEDGDADNHASASVGDTLTFTLTAKVPDTTEYTNYYQFAFVDTLSDGLTFNEITSVKIDKDTLNTPADYTVTKTPAVDNGELRIDFGTKQNAESTDIYNAKTLFSNKAGQTITVTYTATLNENAEVAIDETNSVHIDYSNNPGHVGTGSSGDTETHQYAFGFDLKKTDGTTGLDGAVFQLWDEDNQPIQLVAVSGEQQNTYRPAKLTTPPSTYEKGALTDVTTPDDGVIHFVGLAEGTYTLHEVSAPDGYNKVETDPTVTITATYNNDGTLDTWSVNSSGQKPVEVVNRAGATLPGTGGIGTVIFTVAGLVLVVAGVAWAMRRRQRD